MINEKKIKSHTDVLDFIYRSDVGTLPDHLWPETLVSIRDVFESYLRRAPKRSARRRAQDLCLLLGWHMGGRPVYLARGDRLLLSIRDELIVQRFTGDNLDELQRQTGLTKSRLYAIIARIRNQQKQARQREYGE